MLYPRFHMNLKERFLQITEFLQLYQNIWENEIMLLYPHPLQGYPLEWVEELAQFREKSDVIRLEKKDVYDFIQNPSLIAFYRRIEELVDVPFIEEYPSMPENHYTFLYVIPKKQHEIRKLAPVVNAFKQKHHIERIVDIGGGIGLLAQALCNEYNLPLITLDMDPELQKTGRERHKKNARHPDNHVEYINVKVDENEPVFKEILTSQTMTLGLHTCGSLANSQIRASAKLGVKGLINFGCCYIKLEGDAFGQNISHFAQSMPYQVKMNHFALTLSCRAHRKMNEKDYDLKQKVKLYRYAIHMLFHDEYGEKELLTLGNSSPKLYDESFGTYALEQFSRVKITPKHTKEELDAYFANKDLQDLIWKMLAAGLIRNALGRVLEMYILLDRMIYLEENGYQTKLYQFFDEETSPRNLGIVGIKN